LKVGKGAGRGFITAARQSGVLLAYSTEPGQIASDSGQGSGPYAAALAAELVKPGQSDLIMFHNVRIAVIEKTHREQVPWTEDGIQRRLRVEFGRSSVDSPPVPKEVSSHDREARNAWTTIKDTGSASILAAFIREFGDTFYGRVARARLQELTNAPVAFSSPTPKVETPKANPQTIRGIWTWKSRCDDGLVEQGEYSFEHSSDGAVSGKCKSSNIDCSSLSGQVAGNKITLKVFHHGFMLNAHSNPMSLILSEDGQSMHGTELSQSHGHCTYALRRSQRDVVPSAEPAGAGRYLRVSPNTFSSRLLRRNSVLGGARLVANDLQLG
jgi:hypothetical protein